MSTMRKTGSAAGGISIVACVHLFGLAIAFFLLAGAVHAQTTLVGDPFITGYDNWEDTYGTGADGDWVTRTIRRPEWGILLVSDTGLSESCDQWSSGSSCPAGKYKAWNMVNKSVAVGDMPSTYDLSATFRTVDDDGLGILFGFQDEDNYFRVGMRKQAGGSYGYPEGVQVAKVIGGVVTPLTVPPDTAWSYPSDNSPFDVDVSVNGQNWTVTVGSGGIPVEINGSDSDLQPGQYGVHSWAQAGGNRWGVQLEEMSISSTTVNATHRFDLSTASPVKWRNLSMVNAEGADNSASARALGSFRLDFRNGRITDDANGYLDATATAPNVDFIGSAIVVDEPDSATMGDYQMRVRLANLDDDGIALLVRVVDDDTFYRVNFARQATGSGDGRPPQGMSIQKCLDGAWTGLYSETTPLFLFTDRIDKGDNTDPATWRDEIPFDVRVTVIGNTISVQVVDDPDGETPTVINYPDVVDEDSPILAGSVGLNVWACGWAQNGCQFSPYGGEAGPLVITPPSDIPGDADNDGDVDKDDAAKLAMYWGQVNADCDFDDDGIVGPGDAAIMAANWGYSPGPTETTNVPEPSALLLLVALAGLGLLHRRKPK